MKAPSARVRDLLRREIWFLEGLHRAGATEAVTERDRSVRLVLHAQLVAIEDEIAALEEHLIEAPLEVPFFSGEVRFVRAAVYLAMFGVAPRPLPGA